MILIRVFAAIFLAYFANAASISRDLCTNYCPNKKGLALNLYTVFPDDEINDTENSNAEHGKYFEGDMILTEAQVAAITFGNTRRNGLRDTTFRWPNATVVYHIEDSVDETQVKMIKEAMHHISSQSCVKFRPQQNDSEHAVYIEALEDGCFSDVGYNIASDSTRTRQRVNLSEGCWYIGTIVHELLHTIGFQHMQSSYDRDDYIKIVWDNICEDDIFNFRKYPKENVTNFGVPYDYDSIMHYGECDFSKNGKRTIIPLQKNAMIGEKTGMSKGDIIKLNRMYNCQDGLIN